MSVKQALTTVTTTRDVPTHQALTRVLVTVATLEMGPLVQVNLYNL